MTRAKTLWIDDPAQLEVLASPVRQAILDRIEGLGPQPVKALAASLEVAADSLYYHVKKLLAVGLLVQRGVQGDGREEEALYDLPARRWHIRYRPEDPAQARALGKVTASILRQAERDFTAGLASEQAVTRGALRNLWSLRLEGALTRDELRALNGHLQAIVELLRKPERGRGGGLYALSWVLAPARAGGGRRAGARRASGRGDRATARPEAGGSRPAGARRPRRRSRDE
ncbi:MAG: helix-turn-helix transcriptional regulator [Myxococcales bacterium]|nr:helix-turn-helix transcriptional regulator [Myxococcales bacterium]